MCTGIRAICICTHLQILRYTTLCPLSTTIIPPTPCALAGGHVQRTDFQCSDCDTRDQTILNLSIEKDVALRCIADGFERTRQAAMAQRESEVDAADSFLNVGSLTEGQWERRVRAAGEKEAKAVDEAVRTMEIKEKRIELVFLRNIERVSVEFQEGLRGLKWNKNGLVDNSAVSATGFQLLMISK